LKKQKRAEELLAKQLSSVARSAVSWMPSLGSATILVRRARALDEIE